MSNFVRSIRFCAFAIIALLMVCARSQADTPADPSFKSGSDERVLTPAASFSGTYRQYQPVTTQIPIRIYNRGSAGTSAASLVGTNAFGATSSFSLDTSLLYGIPANGYRDMQLSLAPNEAGNPLSIFYELEFSSDTAMAAPHVKLDLTAYATVLAAGDYNSDNRVNSVDYLLWRKSSVTNGGNVTPWTSGDSNGDGVVDSKDYGNFRKDYNIVLASTSDGTGLRVSGPVSVPEPGAAILGLFGLNAFGLHMLSRSRRRRRLI